MDFIDAVDYTTEGMDVCDPSYSEGWTVYDGPEEAHTNACEDTYEW